MSITKATFDQIDDTTSRLYNTDIKTYTADAWQEIGPHINPGNWINGIDSGGNADPPQRVRIALQMDGTWRIRGMVQYVGGGADQITSIFQKNEVPFLKEIEFRTHYGRSFTITDGGTGSLSYNLIFGLGTGPDAANIVLGVGVLGPTPAISLNTGTIVPCDITLYPTTT